MRDLPWTTTPKAPPSGKKAPAISDETPRVTDDEQPAPPLRLLASLAAVVGVLLLLGVILWPRPRSAAPCTQAGEWLSAIIAMGRSGRYDLASQTAETALANPALCPVERAALQRSAVNDSLSALLALPYGSHDASFQVRA